MSLVGARPLREGDGKGADRGVDGLLYFYESKDDRAKIIVQVKGGGVKRDDIATLLRAANRLRERGESASSFGKSHFLSRSDAAARSTTVRERISGWNCPRRESARALPIGSGLADSLVSVQPVVPGLMENVEPMARYEAAYGTAKEAHQEAFNTLQAADVAATTFLGNVRKMLTSFLGNFWSTQWEPTGFPDKSTAVPSSQDKRMNLCASLQIYFTNVPAQEVAALGVTAANAQARFDAISGARDAEALKDEDQTTRKQARPTFASFSVVNFFRFGCGALGLVLRSGRLRRVARLALQ